MNYKKTDIKSYNFKLPQEFIAQIPNENREKCKLLVANSKTGEIKHEIFENIPNFLPKNSLLVMNSTKVIPARFFMKKQSGGQIELLCVAPILPTSDPQLALNITQKASWECIIGGRKVVAGSELFPLENCDFELNFTAKVLNRYENKAQVEFSWSSDETFGEIIQKIGKIPLPPYIRRQTNAKDAEFYQTIYAETEGSVAAPTAGMHFTEEILAKIAENNIKIENIVLHIGPGTFAPIKNSVAEHKMHFEQIFIEKHFVETLAGEYRKPEKFVIATGTTTLRTLETLYWLGVKALRNEFSYAEENIKLEQEYAYSIEKNYDLAEVFSALLEKFAEYKISVLECKTQLFVHPPYKIHTINALITNFHHPNSTLLLLVASFVGEKNLKKIYNEAINENYKFLSYGDTSLLFNI